MDIPRTLAALGELVPTYTLLRAGITSHQLTTAVRRGDIVRVRQGWYGVPTTPVDLFEAPRVGGRLTCVSAARQLGLMTRGGGLHVEVPAHAVRLRDPDDYRKRLDGGAHVHWHGAAVDGTSVCVSASEALRAMALCVTPELSIAAIDSALRLGLITLHDWMRQLQSLPRRLRRLLAMVDSRSESITESVVRFRLAMLGISAALQVHFRGVGRVDLLIGTGLVIEVDGRNYHTDIEKFERDRQRDARLSALGIRVLRFSYRQVFERWHEVRAAIVAAIARGDSVR